MRIIHECALYMSVCYTQISYQFVIKKQGCSLYMSACYTLINTVIAAIFPIGAKF